MNDVGLENSELESAYDRLSSYCRDRNYEGFDPFDGLNSRLFQATPLPRFRFARLAWTQLFKRSPINLRNLAGVPAQKNSKGIALFALAELARFRTLRTKQSEAVARELLNDLLSMRLDGFSGATWGYNFDWQGRSFFAPRGTPTIVPTAFAVRALLEAADAFGDDAYLKIARGACDFILIDLNRSFESEDEVCFSYSPIDRSRVFNASLLASESLARVAALTGEQDLTAIAVCGARYVVNRQQADGAWAYGGDEFQSWSDNFHTAFILTSLMRIMNVSEASKTEFHEATKRGYKYWRGNFFLADGWPKYYDDRLYPVDAHSAGAGIVALLEMRSIDERAAKLAEDIALWTIRNLRDQSGYFYYQRHRCYVIQTPYMRWSEAWMMYALAKLLEG